ncbi:pilus assembly protein, partial [Pyxidicoccus sp. 3LG]
FNYRMPIPFANMVIFNITRAREVASTLMLGDTSDVSWDSGYGGRYASQYVAAADDGIYIMPIRATYNMRMQSNLYPSANPLPSSNECVFSH